MMTDYTRLPLEKQVAQLFMVGYEGRELQSGLRRFLEAGVGGLIFFRDNFESYPQADEPHVVLTAHAIWRLLSDLRKMSPADSSPPPLFGIDQEGGQVERLPHTMFPTTVTPRAVALAQNSDAQAQAIYRLMAMRLAALGFNLNFCPTLDVNLNARNPIIGVRAFGDDPETVWRLGHIAIQEMMAAGIIPVGKHFPGHGNGTVDSHLDLPTLHYTETELYPFQQAILSDLPAMLVAHGVYPALQTTSEEQALPSSASPVVLQTLLREKCGFKGVIITDDLCMGAITRHRNPVEAALAALRAGVDILLYRRSGDEEWNVYQAVLEAFRSGDLPISLLEQSLVRIAALKNRFSRSFEQTRFNETEWAPDVCRREADQAALATVSILGGALVEAPSEGPLPVPLTSRLLLVHPDRSNLGNYAWDVATSENLDVIFRQVGFQTVHSVAYPFQQALAISNQLDGLTQSPDYIVFVAFNALLNEEQALLYRQLQERFPQAALILVSAATPYDAQLMPDCRLHLGLCSYRPASMRALAQIVAQGLSLLLVDSTNDVSSHSTKAFLNR